jgi:hypothetical protein
MVGRDDYYHKQYQECLRLAEAATDKNSKLMFKSCAAIWLEMGRANQRWLSKISQSELTAVRASPRIARSAVASRVRQAS